MRWVCEDFSYFRASTGNPGVLRHNSVNCGQFTYAKSAKNADLLKGCIKGSKCLLESPRTRRFDSGTAPSPHRLEKHLKVCEGWHWDWVLQTKLWFFDDIGRTAGCWSLSWSHLRGNRWECLLKSGEKPRQEFFQVQHTFQTEALNLKEEKRALWLVLDPRPSFIGLSSLFEVWLWLKKHFRQCGQLCDWRTTQLPIMHLPGTVNSLHGE